MNYQSLLYFKTVAELQHYTRAANELFITQPALSKAIRNLEIELGCNLFKKDGRNVVLTHYGIHFYDYVKKALQEIDKGISEIRHMVEVENNTIFISALFSLYARYLPDKILNFRHKHPACRFSIEYRFTTNILDDVLKGHSELGICSNFTAEGKYAPLDSSPLYQEPLGLIVGREHPFASRKRITIEELKDEAFVVYHWSSVGTNKILLDLCSPYHFQPSTFIEGYSDYGVMGMVAAGDGIAILPTSDYQNNNSVVSVEIDSPVPLVRTINLVWRRDRALPPLVTLFRDMLVSDSSFNQK